MTILNLFSGYNTFTDMARSYGHTVICLDIKNYRSCTPQDILCDFLEFDFNIFPAAHFDFILIGFPCYTFSKASGGFHFKNNSIPLTDKAHSSIAMLLKLRELLSYFSRAIYVLENPVGGIERNIHFKNIFHHDHINIYKVYQYSFGHSAFKHTLLISNVNTVLLYNPVHRLKGKNKSAKFDNLTLKQRQSYPIEFCHFLLDFAIQHYSPVLE